MTERVVITGAGIISCLGNDTAAVRDALHVGDPHCAATGPYRRGYAPISPARRKSTCQSTSIASSGVSWNAAGYAYLSLQQAIAQADLTESEISHPRTGIIAGSGGIVCKPSRGGRYSARARHSPCKPYRVTQTMGSTVSACLATPFQIKGVNYSISSACSTSAHCIGNAMELIQLGKQDVVFAGGGEELHWTMSVLFDAMGALSSQYNETPERASRAYDADRDGFVIAGGGGMLVVESLSHAKARGATILAELVGYGATSDGYDMVAPSGEGAVRCMQQAMAGLEGKIDYVNAHGTSTPAGDIQELNAMRTVFGEHAPVIGSTTLSGHSLVLPACKRPSIPCS